jgi:hypothetical protein
MMHHSLMQRIWSRQNQLKCIIREFMASRSTKQAYTTGIGKKCNNHLFQMAHKGNVDDLRSIAMDENNAMEEISAPSDLQHSALPDN